MREVLRGFRILLLPKELRERNGRDVLLLCQTIKKVKVRRILNNSLVEATEPRSENFEGQDYFNNHARAMSVRNAFLLMDLLLIEYKEKEIKFQDQSTLGSSSSTFRY